MGIIGVDISQPICPSLIKRIGAEKHKDVISAFFYKIYWDKQVCKSAIVYSSYYYHYNITFLPKVFAPHKKSQSHYSLKLY